MRARDLDDAYLSDTIVDIWTMSRHTYGSPRVHAELKLGLNVHCSRKRVERLMRQANIAGITEHRTADGKAYLAVVLDAFSRHVVGWSIADHLRTELVVDALQMAIWRRRPPAGQTIAHSDHGSTYTSWAFK